MNNSLCKAERQEHSWVLVTVSEFPILAILCDQILQFPHHYFLCEMLSYDAALKVKSSNLSVGSSMTLLHTATDLLSKIKSQYSSGYKGRT